MGIKVTGLRELEKKLKANASMEDVKRVVRMNGAELQMKAMRNAPYDTGNLKRSIGLEVTNAGTTAIVGAKAEYGEYVENGTRFMEAQPFVGPAFQEQKEQFKKDLKKLMR